MLLYQLTITALLLVPFGIAVWNFFSFAAIRRHERSGHEPRVSVLVPARDEERSIERCIRSLLEQSYANYELIVLDDSSGDRTAEILAMLSREDPRLRVIAGIELPSGWVGKNWACWQLSNHAAGEWMIFTDADTIHSPESIAATIACAEHEALEFLSGVPHQTMQGFWERVIIPMTQFLYFAYLPNRWITTQRDRRFSAANGQLLCITRTGYDTIGGHDAARGQLVEDVWLAREAKRVGLRVALATAIETVECRMYTSLGEIVAGFSKNLFPGLGYSIPGLIFFVLSSLLLYVVPLIFLAGGFLDGGFTVQHFWLPLLQLLIACSMRGLMAIRFGMGWDQIVHHPLSSLMAAFIAVNSACWALSKQGARWKGRNYPGG